MHWRYVTISIESIHRVNLIPVKQGGYNIESICASTNAVARILVGEAPPELPPVVANEVATELVWQVGMVQSKHWKSVDPKALEPKEGASSENASSLLIISCLQTMETLLLRSQVSTLNLISII